MVAIMEYVLFYMLLKKLAFYLKYFSKTILCNQYCAGYISRF